MEKIITQSLKRAITYPQYRVLIDQLLSENKTTGPNQAEEMLSYTKMNVTRMSRIDKTFQPSKPSIEKLKSIDKAITIVCITEAWCGDASQIVPVVYKLSTLSDKIDLKLVLRDENPHLMDLFLTNGGKAIPKFIVLNEDKMEVLGHWGPRPQEGQNLITEWKKDPSIDIKKEIQAWYNKDKGVHTENEFINYLKSVV